jgi:hypothetical protein
MTDTAAIDGVAATLLDQIERDARASIDHARLSIARNELILAGTAAVRLRCARLAPAPGLITCDLCGGYGIVGGLVVGDRVEDETCHRCHGTGRVALEVNREEPHVHDGNCVHPDGVFDCPAEIAEAARAVTP